MTINNNLKGVMVLFMLSLIFLMAGNNILSLTNPDEVFYAQTAKEMAQQKTWLVPYLFGKPQFEKPILTYWLLRIGFMLFGVTNFGARFFPALFGMIGVIAVYILCLACYADRKKAFLCAFVLMTSGLYIGLSRTVFTDMIFSVFILLSLTSFFLGYTKKNMKGAGIILFFIFSALAVLTKGPLGFLIPLLAVVIFLAIRKEIGFLFCRYCWWGFLLFLLIAVPWYIFMLNKFSSSFIREFFYNDHIRRIFEAEHKSNDTWYFYPLSALLGMFPWSIFVAAAFVYLLSKLRQGSPLPIYSFLFSWIFATFVIFQIAHSKLISYVFPLFPALAVLAGDFIYEKSVSSRRLMYFLSVATLVIFLLVPIGLIFAAIRYPMYAGALVFRNGFIALFIIAVFVQMAILKRRPAFLPYLLAFNFITILFFSFINHAKFDDYLSSRQAGRYLNNNLNTSGVILCAKFFVRGVRFYTDKEVAVVNLGGSKFFSPHPIPYLDTDKKVISFLKEQRIAYAVFKRSLLDDLERIAKKGFTFDVLRQIGDEYIVMIQKK